MLLLFRSSHLHPKNIRASWFESAMFFFQFLILSDHSSNCTAWSALISGMKAVLLKVKPWNLFELGPIRPIRVPPQLNGSMFVFYPFLLIPNSMSAETQLPPRQCCSELKTLFP